MSDFEGYSSDKEECNCLSDVESEIEYFFEPKKSFINKNKTMEDSEEENSENKIKDNKNEELNSDKINLNKRKIRELKKTIFIIKLNCGHKHCLC